MANIKEIQNRIKSIQDTMKITNAMYMISSIQDEEERRKKLTDTEPYFYATAVRDLAVSCGIFRISSSRYFDAAGRDSEREKKDRFTLS